MYPTDPIDQVREGMDVYGSDGKKIGEVGEVNIGTQLGEVSSNSVTEERSFFEVRRGFLGLGDDLYVPAEQVDSVSNDGVTLRHASDSQELAEWTTRPATPEPSAEGDDRDLLGV